MKARNVENHDYITVSAINGSCRMNMTTSYGGSKVTTSAKPTDPNYASFAACAMTRCTLPH